MEMVSQCLPPDPWGPCSPNPSSRSRNKEGAMSLLSSSCDTEAAPPLSLAPRPAMVPPQGGPQEGCCPTLACVTASRLPAPAPLPIHTLAANFFLHQEASESLRTMLSGPKPHFIPSGENLQKFASQKGQVVPLLHQGLGWRGDVGWGREGFVS